MSLDRKVVASLVAILSAPVVGATIPLIPVSPSDPAEQPVSLQAPVVSPAISFSVPRYTLSDRERNLVAACLVLEAASQGEFGMRGVMAVIRNRSRGFPELFATTVLRQKQFSALNQFTAGRESWRRVMLRARSDPMWNTALRIVDEATQETWYDPTGGATHYTLTGERTSWTRSLARTAIIGRHSFYR